MGVYAAFRVPEDWTVSCGVDWSNAAAARAVLLDHFSGWSPELCDLLRSCDDTIFPVASTLSRSDTRGREPRA